MIVDFPFGNTSMPLDISDALSFEVLKSDVDNALCDYTGDDIVRHAMANPVASPTLRELAVGKRDATIIISDHTRPVPSRCIIPHMLRELRLGSPEIDVTLLVATGFHRGTTKAELAEKLGDEIVNNERIVVHDCGDSEQNVTIGTLPSGAPLTINKVAANASLLVSEGFIEPHFFAGFSGGRKSVLPGVCARETVLGNHCAQFIDSRYARTGVLEHNPIHEDMVAAAKLASLRYIVNVIIDDEKRVTHAFAGEPFAAHAAGCELLSRACQKKASRAGDIVISSNGGAPLDQNIYQSVKGLTAAEAVAAPDAVLIMVARCNDGAGGDGFYEAMRSCSNPEELLSRIRRVPMQETQPDQWEYQILARVLSKHRVIYVASPDMRHLFPDMKLGFSESLQDAFSLALAEKGLNAHIIAIPNGISVIPSL